MSDNDNDRHGRKPPPRPTKEVPVNKLSRSLHETDAHRIHREAEEARATLARTLAAAVCADPSALTPEKMRRLGKTGLMVLVEALRSSLPEPASRRTAKAAGAPTKPIASASSKQPPVAAARPVRFARMSGWWDDPPPSSGLAPALMRGLLLGAFLDLVAIAGLLAAGF